MSARVIIPEVHGPWKEVIENNGHRELGFFDEILTGYAIFNKSDNEEVRNACVEISLLDKTNSQIIPVKTINLEKAISDTGNQTVHKFEFFTMFPKTKLHEPILHIRLKGVLQSVSNAGNEGEGQDEEKLVRFEPASKPNMLEGLNFSVRSSQNESKIVLFESMIGKNQENHVQEFKLTEVHDEFEMPIIRTLNLRIRNIKLKNNTLISTLDIEHSSKSKELDINIELKSIDFKTNPFKPIFHTEFPLCLSKSGSYSFSFQLQTSFQVKNTHTLIEIRYTINSTNKIQTSLYTNIDLNQVGSATQKLSTSSLAVANTQLNTINSLTIKFIGNKIVKVGQPFKLNVFISNQSAKERNLLMIFNSNTAQTAPIFQPNLPKIKSLIYSSPSLLDTYSNLRLKTQGILALVNEVRFLLTAFDTNDGRNVSQNSIELVALETGVFNLQGVKLVDLGTGETLNCDRLLEIVVEQ